MRVPASTTPSAGVPASSPRPAIAGTTLRPDHLPDAAHSRALIAPVATKSTDRPSAPADPPPAPGSDPPVVPQTFRRPSGLLGTSATYRRRPRSPGSAPVPCRWLRPVAHRSARSRRSPSPPESTPSHQSIPPDAAHSAHSAVHERTRPQTPRGWVWFGRTPAKWLSAQDTGECSSAWEISLTGISILSRQPWPAGWAGDTTHDAGKATAATTLRRLLPYFSFFLGGLRE